MADKDLTRRDLLVRSAAGAAALQSGVMVAGCEPGGEAGDTDGTDEVYEPPPFDPPTSAVVVTKGPWVTIQGAGAVRIRFETRDDVALPVRVEREAEGAWHEPTRATHDVQYERPTFNLGTTSDEPGIHVLHDVILDDLTPGETIAWALWHGGGETRTGTFRVPPVGEGTARMVWIADTMAPNELAAGNYELMPEAQPDVVVHGGDITYNSLPSDTWNHFFEKMRPTLETCPFQVTIGNHDSDLPHELEDVFDRLFDGQGDNQGTRYHAFTVGVARVILLDSETFEIVADEQRDFLLAELDKADADPGIKCVMVGFHRPLVTFSKYYKVENFARFDLFHGWIKDRVDIVLVGHAHCFEHFDIEGVHYIVDGGGGSLLYNVDVNLENARNDRPEWVEARKHKDLAYGFSVFDVAEDGSVQVTRRSPEEDALEISFTIPARS